MGTHTRKGLIEERDIINSFVEEAMLELGLK